MILQLDCLVAVCTIKPLQIVSERGRGFTSNIAASLIQKRAIASTLIYPIEMLLKNISLVYFYR